MRREQEAGLLYEEGAKAVRAGGHELHMVAGHLIFMIKRGPSAPVARKKLGRSGDEGFERRRCGAFYGEAGARHWICGLASSPRPVAARWLWQAAHLLPVSFQDGAVVVLPWIVLRVQTRLLLFLAEVLLTRAGPAL